MNLLKGFLVSLFTEHLLAKFFAMVFAAATVILIEREISTPIPYIDERVPIYVGRAPDRAEESSAYVLLQAEPGVWVAQPPAAVKIQVSGPKNERAAFLLNPVIRLRIRQEQVPPGDGPDLKRITVAENSFEADVPDLAVRLLEPLELAVDRVVTREGVPAQVLPPTGLPENRVFDGDRSELRPETVTIRGPRSVVGKFTDDQRVTLVLDHDGRSVPIVNDEEYPLKLSKDLVSRGVALSMSSKPKVLIALKAPTLEKIRLGELAIHWSLTEEVRQALAANELEIVLDNSFVREADLVLEGPPELTRQYEGTEARRQLARQIYVIADPNEDIATLGDTEKVTSVRLQAIGTPAGLKATLDPETLVITLSRKDSSNK